MTGVSTLRGFVSLLMGCLLTVALGCGNGEEGDGGSADAGGDEAVDVAVKDATEAEDSESAEENDGGISEDVVADASDTGANGADDTGADTSPDTRISEDVSSGPPGECEHATLEFEIREQQPDQEQAGPARLAVYWFQLNDDLSNADPQIVYDEQFDPSADSSVSIPVHTLTKPRQRNVICERADGCTDAGACACQSGPEFGFAQVAVVRDANDDGQIDASELQEPDNARGVGDMILGWAAQDYPQSETPGIIASEMEQGCEPYEVLRDNSTGFDSLSIDSFTTVFDLVVCAGPGNTCELPSPELS
jgi:hypothetical protein